MSQPETLVSQGSGLAEIVDHLVERGAVLSGEAAISLAGVDLVYLRLNLILASMATLEQSGSRPSWALPRPRGVLPSSSAEPAAEGAPTASAAATAPSWLPGAAAAGSSVLPEDMPGAGPDPGQPGMESTAKPKESPEKGLAQLVLTLVELLREVIERQAVRRMETGGLTDQQVEKMGLALRDLEAKMTELREIFGIQPGDLGLDLGPLGRLA